MFFQTQTIVFGGGCFWCIEAIFLRLKGIHVVVSGYAGGNVPNPTYKDVCEGNTGHAEVVKVEYDPSVISLETLLAVFFSMHDPTTLNRQGNDVGTQYRSIILYTTDEQKEVIEYYRKKLAEDEVFANRIVTEVHPLDVFYEAEGYHREYYDRNQEQPYCQFIIDPKIQKLKKMWAHLLKDD